MNAAMIDDLVKSLGRTYSEMMSSGMYLPGGPPKGMFDGDQTSSMSPAIGIEMGFQAIHDLSLSTSTCIQRPTMIPHTKEGCHVSSNDE